MRRILSMLRMSAFHGRAGRDPVVRRQGGTDRLIRMPAGKTRLSARTNAVDETHGRIVMEDAAISLFRLNGDLQNRVDPSGLTS